MKTNDLTIKIKFQIMNNKKCFKLSKKLIKFKIIKKIKNIHKLLTFYNNNIINILKIYNTNNKNLKITKKY